MAEKFRIVDVDTQPSSDVTFDRPKERFQLVDVTNEPTPEEKREALLRGAEEGLYVGGAGTVGAIGGGKAGALMGSAFGPAGTFVGGAAGAIAGGLLTAKAAEEAAKKLLPQDDDEETAPYREGGKTFGQGIAMAPSAFFLPKSMATSLLPKFISELGMKARKHPLSYIGAEAGSAAGAGIGAGAAESYDPGDPLTRFGAEIAGGALSPFKLIIGNVGPLITGLKNQIKTYSRGGREERAASLIIDALERNKENPEQLSKELKRLNSLIATPSSAQLTGSPTLISLEKSLGTGSPSFLAHIDKQGKQAFEAYQDVIGSLQAIGDPPLLLQQRCRKTCLAQCFRQIGWRLKQRRPAALRPFV
jgi:hypothetical protein